MAVKSQKLLYLRREEWTWLVNAPAIRILMRQVIFILCHQGSTRTTTADLFCLMHLTIIAQSLLDLDPILMVFLCPWVVLLNYSYSLVFLMVRIESRIYSTSMGLLEPPITFSASNISKGNPAWADYVKVWIITVLNFTSDFCCLLWTRERT